MKLLLTGASGFVGRNLLELFPKNIEIVGIYNTSKDIESFVELKKLKNVTLYKCNLLNKLEVEKLSEKIGSNFDYCIYLAANVNVPLSINQPSEDYKITVQGLINFLDKFNCGRFIYLSSAAVYDGLNGIVNTNKSLNPTNPYAISKLTAENYVKFFTYLNQIREYVIIRFGGAFGLYSKETKFMTDLVKKIYLQGKNKIEVYGDGTNKINVIYVKDLIKALLMSLNSNKKNIVCNLGLETMTIDSTVYGVAKVFNKKIEINHIPRRQDQKYIGFEIESDFNSVFSFKPDYSFEEGIFEFGKKLKEVLQ